MGLDTRGSCRVDPTADPATRLLLLCWCMAWHGMAWDGTGWVVHPQALQCRYVPSASVILYVVSKTQPARKKERSVCKLPLIDDPQLWVWFGIDLVWTLSW